MKIITAPSVYLIGSQVINDVQLEAFLADHDTEWKDGTDGASHCVAEELTEFGGRLCYMSFGSPRPGGNEAYLAHIKDSGHGSVLEHAVWNFAICGISRTLSHELVRHRMGVAYSQLSQRYVDESVAEYVEPDIIASDPELHKEWTIAVAAAHDAYLSLVDKIKLKLDTDNAFFKRWTTTDAPRDGYPKTELRKLARQAARSVLPNATETKIFFTANARALRHILEQRGSRFAEPEIRKLANELHRQLVESSPHIFGDYEKVPLPDGTWELVTKTRKV